MSKRLYRLLLVAAAALAGLALGIIPAGLLYNYVVESNAARQYPAPARFITVNGIRIHYLCDGIGDPPLVLLHASPGSLLDWTLVFPTLAERQRVCAFDRPGYGWSEPLPDPMGLQTSAAHLRATLATLNIARPVLVGHSIGGALALAAAAQDPQAVRGLVLLDPTAPAEAESVRRDLLSLARLRPLFPLGITHLVERRTMRNLLQQTSSGETDVSRGLAEQIASVNVRTSAVDTLARNAAPVADDLEALAGELGRITVPVLVLAPGGDLSEPRPALQELTRALPNARLEVIEDSRHYLQLAQPDAVAEAILTFAREQ